MTLAANDRYRRNLAALRAFQPEVAAAIDAAPTPADVSPATGRDGSETLLVPGDDGRPRWFGQSSMPRISAEEMLGNVRRDGGGALLPGVLTGVEPLVLADRLAPYSAVFVVEQSPLSVKLAMHLHDYTALLASGRLVFLVGEDVGASLREFFESHPGYEMPGQLFKVPQRSPAQTADVQRRLELSAAGVLHAQARVVDSWAQAIRRRFDEGGVSRSLPAEPKVALVSADPRAESLEQAARIERALDRLRWRFESCLPDAPGKCHVAARLRAIERAGADFILCVDGFAYAARPLLPARLPVVSWYLPGARVCRVAAEQVGPFDLFLASSPSLQAELASAGAPTGAIERCDPAADDTVYHTLPLPDDERAEIGLDVVMLADLPDDRPEAAGVTLPSHVALWRAVQQAVRGEVERYRDEDADRLFERAQRLSGTAIREPSIRDRFLELLRARIAPAAVGRASGRALVESGRRVTVWGSNWSTAAGGGETSRGPVPVGRELNVIFNAAGWVVLPASSSWAVQMAVDALAAGASVACRAGNVPFAEEYPGLASLAPHIRFFRTSRDLINLMRLRESPGGVDREQAAAAQRAVLADHTVAGRLIQMAGRLRQRQCAALGGWCVDTGVSSGGMPDGTA